MGGYLDGGADVFVGITGSGKTTLAEKEMRHVMELRALAGVILDLEQALDWANVPHVVSVDALLEGIYVKKMKGLFVWTPNDEAERAKFFKAVGCWGRIAVLVDGLPMIADAHNFEDEFRKSLYKHRHGRLGPTWWKLVSQRMSLIHRHVFAACRIVNIFRQAPGIDAKRCLEEFGVPVKVSTNLKRGEHVKILLGFPEEGVDSKGADARSREPAPKAGGENPAPQAHGVDGAPMVPVHTGQDPD